MCVSGFKYAKHLYQTIIDIQTPKQKKSPYKTIHFETVAQFFSLSLVFYVLSECNFVTSSMFSYFIHFVVLQRKYFEHTDEC